MKIIDFIVKTVKGKTIYRILFNWKVKEHCSPISGKTIDLAGGESDYYAYLPKGLEIIRTNREKFSGTDLAVDFNKPLHFESDSIDNVFLFNAIYIAEDGVGLLAEVMRILVPGGRLFVASPFIANEMPEPHDYVRPTAEGLEKELKQAGFSDIKIERFGERFSSAAYLLHPFFLFGIIRLPFNVLAIVLDKLIPKRIRSTHPAPLGYFCIVEKSNYV